ncbi:unnamed protein product [Mytilus edulis]|uniref:Uncharacterized protein n=1 Tax=Mytilus edulis TaxID=6550 RepID=A0A8S3V141_MYTED|nr:unnamed protein product [Mytilus edulis]
MSFSVWKKLSNSQRNRCLQKGSWEHIVSEGIKRYNPYCVYMFRWHRVSVARIRARQKCAPLFSGEAECKFKDCKNICKFSMNQNNRVHLKMNSTVKHRMSENHSRGETREKLKTIFKEGQKPYKHFLQRMKDTAKDVKIAGNFSNTGNTPRTFQQISSESRYKNKLDKSEFESLVKLSSQMETEITSKHSPGFIQHVSILPPYIMYWTETGIRIWHDLAKSSVVHWDATGGLLSRRNDQYKFYYYELA